MKQGEFTHARLTSKGKRRLARSRHLLLAWLKANFGTHLSEDQLLALGGALERVLAGHGRWEGQTEYLRVHRQEGAR